MTSRRHAGNTNPRSLSGLGLAHLIVRAPALAGHRLHRGHAQVAVSRRQADPAPPLQTTPTQRDQERPTMTTALFTGFGLGFLVAAQVGPISLLAARSVILGRFGTGIMIGLGAATIDTAYGALGLAGAASLLRITGLRLGLGLLGSSASAAPSSPRSRWTHRHPERLRHRTRHRARRRRRPSLAHPPQSRSQGHPALGVTGRQWPSRPAGSRWPRTARRAGSRPRPRTGRAAP